MPVEKRESWCVCVCGYLISFESFQVSGQKGDLKAISSHTLVDVSGIVFGLFFIGLRFVLWFVHWRRECSPDKR